MRLKIVLHIKIQFASSDLMLLNKTHFRRRFQGRTGQALLCHRVAVLLHCRGVEAKAHVVIVTVRRMWHMSQPQFGAGDASG